MRVKKSSFIYLISNIIIIILLISSFIYITRLKEMYRTATFIKRENFNVSYSEGIGGINVELILSHDWDDTFYLSLRFSTRITGDVEAVGFSSVNYDVFTNDNYLVERQANWVVPELYYNDLFLVNLVRNDEIVCIGVVNVSFLIASIVQNEIIEFEINYVMPVSFSGIYYDLEYPLYLLQFVLIILIGVSSLILIKIIRSIIIDVRITDEAKQKDDKFYSYVKSKIEKQNQE